MTEKIDGHLGFFRSDLGTGAATIRLLGIIHGETSQPPEIEIRRVIVTTPGDGTELDPLDVKRGNITVAELNASGVVATAKGGSALVRLTGAAIKQGPAFVWEFTVSISAAVVVPKGKELQLVLRAHVSPGEPFVEVARVVITGITAQLNSTSPAALALFANIVPRLSVGINQATPKTPPAQYSPATPPGGASTRLTPGSGSAANVGQPQSTAADLNAALYRVFVLLDDPTTLDPVWDVQTSDRTLFSLSSSLVARDPVRVAEEVWARQVTEMLAFTPYGGPSGTYGLSPESRFISQGLNNPQNPQYSVTYACQQLASFALASRGIKFGPLGKTGELLLNAGATAALTFTKATGGNWIVFNGETPVVVTPDGSAGTLNGSGPPTTAAAYFNANNPVTPGSVFLFANRPPKNDVSTFQAGNGCVITDLGNGPVEFCSQTDSSGKISSVASRIKPVTAGGQNTDLLADNTANAHVAFVLRTDDRLQVFQPLDTGGLSVPNRGAGVSVFSGGSGFHSGNFDDPAGITIKGGDPFRGMGALPKLAPSAAPQLQDRVNTVLKKALPLGFARFVIISRAAKQSNVEFKPGNARDLILKNRLIYASPLLRMNGPADTQNYAISRYLWSLRDFPASSTMEAWWFLYIPQGELAKATLAALRTDSLATVANDAFKLIQKAAKAGAKPFVNRDVQFSVGGDKITADIEKIVQRLTTPILDCTVTPSGTSLVTATMRSPSNLHALHMLESLAPSSNPKLPNLPMTTPFPLNASGVPPYFNG